MSEAETYIPAFFAGRNIFITGATGFMGKVLIEKLLRSCPDIGQLFLLVRPKKGCNIDQRIKRMLDNSLFDKLRVEQQSSFDKLVPVAGDATAKGLGLMPTDRQTLIERVSVIFHVAASVRFDESLKDAIFNNTRSTRDVCVLAKTMKKLVALVHVSSTYTQIDKCVVDEILYPADIDYRQTIDVAESVDEHTLRMFTAKYIGQMPNTYIFTKRLAEEAIQEYSEKYLVPCVVLRPSIVVSTVNDPVKGWLDNFNGPIGMLIGGGKGVLRVMFVDPSVNSDFMAVDVAIKAMIIATWKRGIKTILEDKAVHVYNCSSYNVKKIDVQHITHLGLKITRDIPLDGVVWSPGTMMTKSRTIYYILVLLLHIMPALLLDGMMKLCGARPTLLKLQRKVYVSNSALSYFLLNEWSFHNKNATDLFDNLNIENKKDFGFPYREIDIKDFFTNGIIGAKLYLLKEDMNKLEQSRLHLKRMDWLDSIVKALFAVIVIWLIYRNEMLFYITKIFTFSGDGSITNAI